ncbi:MAG TPA: hypothetical protein VMM35_09635 [Longimicrobiales bacterium]|nr:hypothetical protein [Longimicrobiales bacterium]
MVGPEAASGFFMSLVVAIIGAFGTLYAMRHVLKEAPVKATRPRRR